MHRAVPAVVLTVAALTGCAQGDAAQGGEAALDVVVGLYPYAYVAERVGGPDVRVRNLTPPGAEPHDLELTPQQVGALGEADVVVYSRDLQPALDAAVDEAAGDRALDVLSVVDVRRYDGDDAAGHAGDGHGQDGHGQDGDDHAGEDPHVWLDPMRLATVADAVAERLAALAPGSADGFRQRAAELTADLRRLDEAYEAGLATCARRDVVTSHDAFGYLTERYGLEQVALSLSPEEDPSPRRLAEVSRTARERGVTTIFFEELVSPRVAEQLAREVGAGVAVLSPLEGAPDDGDYLTAMRGNLDALRAALACP